jgi:hypothetical protein
MEQQPDREAEENYPAEKVTDGQLPRRRHGRAHYAQEVRSR